MKVHQGVTLDVVEQQARARAGRRADARDAAHAARRLERRRARDRLGLDGRRGLPRALRRPRRDQRRRARRARHAAPARDGGEQTTHTGARAGRARRDARAARRGHRRGRRGPLRRAHVRARHVRDGRRARRALRGDARQRRLLLPHHRNYGSHAIEAYRDSIEIARRADVPMRLAHCHLGFPGNRGRAGQLLRHARRGPRSRRRHRARRVPVPRPGSARAHAFLPGWALAGGSEATIARLRDPALRERLRHELEDVGTDGHHGVPVDWAAIVVDGSSIAERASAAGERPIDVYCALCARAGARRARSTTSRATRRTCARSCGTPPRAHGRLSTASSSARARTPAAGAPPRYLAVYVRELGLLPLEQAIRRFTSLPAQRLRLPARPPAARGWRRTSSCSTRTACATRRPEEPRQLPEGIPYVLVNGVVVADDSTHTGATPGRGLRSG